MLKNKFKIIGLLFIILSLIIVPVVKAENEVNNDNIIISEDPQANDNQQTDITTEQSSESQNIQNSENNFKKSDVYLVGDNITVDYIVDGNLFICANSVTIKSQIGGDAFILANSLNIEQDGYIFSNLFTTSNEVNIKGVVYDVYALSNNLTISGYVYRDVRLSCKNLNILGTIGRNAFVNCNNMSFQTANDTESQETTNTITANSSIVGDLNYSSPNEISVPENVVKGNVNYSKSSEYSNSAFDIKDNIFSLITFIVTVIIIWLICLWLAPKFVESTKTLSKKKVATTILLGILAPIALIVLSAILIIAKFTTPIGFYLVGLLIILMSISTSIFVISLNNIICDKLKLTKSIQILGMLILSCIVLKLISYIPFLGPLVGFVAVIYGTGTVLYNLFIKTKSINNKNDENSKKQDKNK